MEPSGAIVHQRPIHRQAAAAAGDSDRVCMRYRPNPLLVISVALLTLAADRRLAMMRRAFLGSMRGSCLGGACFADTASGAGGWCVPRASCKPACNAPSRPTDVDECRCASLGPAVSPGEGQARAGGRPCPCACAAAPGTAGGAPRSAVSWAVRHPPLRCWCRGRGWERVGRRCHLRGGRSEGQE